MKSFCLTALLFITLAGCSSNQSALNAHGHSAIALQHLIIGMIVICTVIWLIVTGFLAWTLIRRGEVRQDEVSTRIMTTSVKSAATATAVIVAGLTLASFYTTRSLSISGHPAVVVTVKAQQWWWQFIYKDQNDVTIFQTANELHVPVGENVQLELESIDVIHSFWVPSLAGKLDLIPGRRNLLTLRADRPGIYRGQCAEFCGLQHSHMALLVIAQDEVDFQRWAAGQAAAAIEPTVEEASAGKAVFNSKPCAACHTVRGTPAVGTSGPDLTHVGGRQTIAAGLLQTTRGSLAAWIADPQTVKPGNNMPTVPLTSDELRQLAAYMETLK
ncbi:cytochrome c oxidase subunit II [Rhizobium grahamii]|uniref:Cytochrome aa3 subunit 2 n=1 Tax=Rhizobium grahamii CCGE 502 TaxID=990285 RepID=S3HEG0_9HYPH|nr:cytochrome c oxidase subunit II [Rhizobium grahamii]EPE96465.1 cytochrome c oxidase subunit II [Rhizobium grahamii CCGE 502]